MRVKIIGEMWWWRVHYQDADGREMLRDANELHIPVGKPVLLELEAADVIHRFWVPRLGGKMDMIPGRTNRLLIPSSEENPSELQQLMPKSFAVFCLNKKT